MNISSLIEIFEYKNVMKNGTIQEKVDIEVSMHRNKLLAEQKSVFQEYQEKVIEERIEIKEEQEIVKMRNRGKGMGI